MRTTFNRRDWRLARADRDRRAFPLATFDPDPPAEEVFFFEEAA
jgi:hypothetical protein